MSALRSRRHRIPEDRTSSLWRATGFEVTGVRTQRVSADPEDPESDSVLLQQHVVRPLRGIDESPPRLRWTIDTAAPAGPRGERWGDTHFARSLAAALERCGQDVSVDSRDARHRSSRDHDDVVLVLRGLDLVAPHPDALNMEWIISHPDLVTAEEIKGFDLVYAASVSWPAQVRRDWGLHVRPLLQCTDPRYFHPDRGVPDTGPAVLFVGNSRGVFRHAVRTALAAEADLTVHGADWDEYLDPQMVASSGVPNDEVGVLYASAGVVLNDHHVDMRRDSFLSNRLFDAAACGARIATDEVSGPRRDVRGAGAALRRRARPRPAGAPAVRRVPGQRDPSRAGEAHRRGAHVRPAGRDPRRGRGHRPARPPALSGSDRRLSPGGRRRTRRRRRAPGRRRPHRGRRA